MHCVDLGESFPTSIYLQKSASIQPRTSLSKFGGKLRRTNIESFEEKGLNGRRTKTSKRQAPKRTEKTETANAKKENEQKKVLSTNIQ